MKAPSLNQRHIYKISQDREFAVNLAHKLLGREISFREVPEDRSFEMTPTLRCRVGEDAFVAFFCLENTKNRNVADFEEIVRDISANYSLSADQNLDTVIVAFTETMFAISHHGSAHAFSSKTKDDLISKVENPDVADIMRRILKIIAPSSDASKLANDFARVLESNNFKNVVTFAGNTLEWGAPIPLPDSVGVISNHELHLFKPRADIRDHILVMHWPHSVRGVSSPRAAHGIARKIADLMYQHDKPIALTLVYGERDAVLIAPGESWDLRVQFHRSRLREPGWVRNCAPLLKSSELPVNRERRRIDHRQLLQSKELDERFNALCADFRLCLIQDLIQNRKGVVAECLNFLRAANDAKIRSTEIDDLIATNRKQQGLFVSIADSIVLRTIVRRFIEVYHSNPFDLPYDSLLAAHGETYETQLSDVGLISRGKKARFRRSQRVKPGHEQGLKKAFQELGGKYRDRYGGDMHFSRVASAVDYLEDQVSSKYLAELLDITNAKSYRFRYEDLRPDALEEYYQRTLETSVQLKMRDGRLVPEVGESRAARKELGAFFTPAEAAVFTIQLSMKRWLDDRSCDVDNAIGIKDWANATIGILKFARIKIVDPTVGGASFLKQAFKELTRPERALKMRSWIAALPNSYRAEFARNLPWLVPEFAFHDFEEHVMKNCLYGVDIDFKGLTIGAYTLTLEALTFMEGSEKFPSLLNRNLKQGNAFVNWLEPNEWTTIDPGSIQKLLALRAQEATASHDLLARLMSDESQLKDSLLAPYKSKRRKEWGVDPSLLNPFCWELEFPEAFYGLDGFPVENPGFDIVIGNPPWEGLRGTEPEFFESIDELWPQGKNSSKEQEARKKILLKSAEVQEARRDYFEKLALYASFLSKSAQYKCQKPKFGPGEARGGSGDPNTYRLATEVFLSLTRKTGSFGFITPEGIAADKGNRDLRTSLIQNGITDIAGFQKQNMVFKSAVQSFCIVAGRSEKPSTHLTYTTGHSEIARATVEHQSTAPVPMTTMRQLAISTLPFLALNSAKDVGIFSRLVAVQAGALRLKGYLELHTTKDMDLSQDKPLTRGYAVIKGQDTGRFLPPKPDSFSYGLNVTAYKKRHPSRAQFLNQERVAWHDVSGTMDRRRMVATVIPPDLACFNSLNVVRPSSTDFDVYFVTGILNSFCYEWIVRLVSKNNHVNMFVVEGIPLPHFEQDDLNSSQISKLSKMLHRLSSESSKRQDIEAELEAHTAHLYGLTYAEFEHLLSAFPKVEDSYKALVLRHFDNLKAQHVA